MAANISVLSKCVRLRSITKRTLLTSSLFYKHPQQKYSSKNLQNYTFNENVHSRRGSMESAIQPPFQLWLYDTTHSLSTLLKQRPGTLAVLVNAMWAFSVLFLSAEISPISLLELSTQASLCLEDKELGLWKKLGFLCFSWITIKQKLISHGAKTSLSSW